MDILALSSLISRPLPFLLSEEAKVSGGGLLARSDLWCPSPFRVSLLLHDLESDLRPVSLSALWDLFFSGAYPSLFGSEPVLCLLSIEPDSF